MSEQQSGAGATAERVASFLGNAAAKAKRQAELVTLNTVTLPKLYHAVGKHLMSVAKLPPDLEKLREAIRQLEARNAERAMPVQSPAEGSEPGGFAAKAAQMAKSAARTAAKAGGDAARTAQIQAEYVAMGKSAVEKYGEKVVPPGEREKFNALVKRREQLTAELASGGKGMPSVALRYFGLLAILGCAFGLAALGRSLLSGRESPQPDAVQAPAKPDWRAHAEQNSARDGKSSESEANGQQFAGPEQLPRDTNQIKTLTAEQAEWLTRHHRNLYLESLANLLPEVAEALAQLNGDLYLNGLSSISNAAAESLAQHSGGSLYLSNATRLSDPAIESLAQHAGHLALGVTSLSDRAAVALGRRKGSLALGGLTQLSDAAAESLGQHVGHLWLNGVTTLSDKAAASLARHQHGTVYLDGLTKLSDKAAKLLKSNDRIRLPDRF